MDTKTVETEMVSRAFDELADVVSANDAKSFDLANSLQGGTDSLGGVWRPDTKINMDGFTLKGLFFTENWIFSCVDLTAMKISNQSLRVMRSVESNGKTVTEHASNHPLSDMLDQPNMWQDYHSWMYNIAVDLVLLGNSISWKQAGNINVPIPAEMIHLDVDPNGKLLRYTAQEYSGTDVLAIQPRRVTQFKPDDIVHLRRPNPSSLLWGMSAFLPGAKPILFNRYSAEYLNNFYLKGATPGMVLEMGADCNEQSAIRLLRSFEMAHTGRKNQRRTLILPKGVTGKNISSSLADQQLRDIIMLNREDILSLLRVPKHEVGLQSSGSLGSEEYKTALKNFWASTLIPLQRIIAGGLSKAYKAELGDGHYLEFDNGDVDILQDDKLAKANLATAMLTTRTLNTIRAEVWEDEPVPGGDVVQGLTPMYPQAAEELAATETRIDPTQVAAIVEMLAKVKAGEVERQSAVGLLRLAYGLSDSEAALLVPPLSTTPQGPSTLPPPNQQPEVEPVLEGESRSLLGDEEEQTPEAKARLDRADRVLKSSGGSWFKKREDAINKGVKRGEARIFNLAMDMFDDQADKAIDVATLLLKEKGLDGLSFKAADVKSSKELKERLDKELAEFEPKWTKNYVKYLESTTELGYDAALAVPFKLPSEQEIDVLRGKNKQKRRQILAARGLQGFAYMSEGTSEKIMKIIQAGVEQGRSVDQISKDIADNIKDVANIQSRAEVIARTETITAVSIGQHAAMEDAAKSIPDLQKMWLNAGDARVRGNPSGLYPESKADHWSIHGDVQDYDKAFSNGLQYPRDATGAAGEVIQCRCTWIMLPKAQMDDIAASNLHTEQGEGPIA